MTKIPKRRLSRFKDRLYSIEKNPPVRIVVYTAFFLFLYFFLPLGLALRHKGILAYVVVFFYPVNIIILFCLFRKDNLRFRRFKVKDEQLRESINLLEDGNSKESEINIALKEKIKRYNNLKNIIDIKE